MEEKTNNHKDLITAMKEMGLNPDDPADVKYYNNVSRAQRMTIVPTPAEESTRPVGSGEPRGADLTQTIKPLKPMPEGKKNDLRDLMSPG